MSQRNITGPVQEQGPGEEPLYHYTRLFVKFLQMVFAANEKGSYHWCEDEAQTDIIISDQGTNGRDVPEKRPSLIVQRGPAAFANLTLDQFYGYDPHTGERLHTDLMSCSMTLTAMSSEGVEAQRIAWIAMMAIRRLKRTLQRHGLHQVGENMQIGPESSPGEVTPDEPNESIIVQVSVPFYFQDAWSVAPVDKVLLKGIDLALTSGATDDIQPKLKSPGMNGRALPVTSTTSLNTRTRVVGSPTPKPRK